MSTTLMKTPTPTGLPQALFQRVLEEGYGAGAWYGNDMRAAIADVPAGDAYRRPAEGEHNIAEVALHHAFWLGEVTRRLTGTKAAFPLEGEDWFELVDESRLSWTEVASTLETAQQRLSQAVSEIASGARISPLGEAERFDQVFGVTGHAAYHAGQIQLIKKLI